MGLRQAVGSAVDWYRAARQVRSRHGKPMTAQLREIREYRRKSMLAGVSDYFYYQLYRDDFPPGVRKEDFAGWRMEDWFNDHLNAPKYTIVADDKLVSYAMLAGSGVSVPPVRAIYAPKSRRFAGADSLTTPAEVVAWLAERAVYPLFVKPVSGTLGAGAWAIESIEPASGRLKFTSGESAAPAEFAAELLDRRASVVSAHGYMFQDCVRQHPEIRQLAPGGVSSVRLVVLWTEAGPRPFRSIWRISVGRNMTDNYVKGRSGNLIAGVDTETGRVGEAVRGQGIDRAVFECHPDSGLPIQGFQLPYWPELLEMSVRAAEVFPMFRLQHWDFALGEGGPCILELNKAGDIAIVQNATRRGLYDDTMRSIVSPLALTRR